MKFCQEVLYYICNKTVDNMDKEEFLKSKLKRIAYNYSINIESPVVFKEIMAELSDIYDEGFNEGYYDGYRDLY